MPKHKIYELLNSKNIHFEVTAHRAVFNMAEASTLKLPYPEDEAKNLFVRDDKKRNYYLITVKGDKKVNLKEFARQNNTRSLSFASGTDLKNYLGLIPGAVTPLGLLNDEECKVLFFLDRAFLESSGLIGVHPNDNTSTIWLKTQDLLDIVQEHGNQIFLVDV
ncbi:prolyl-tRNA synthetase associated domain-containing protein [Turicimonas muris]|uniref:prolyl-tRNA synthetase associated domain-containing protein n=1 Tax=Turicimonas muris TaxID=1796652 RepID=UPI0023F0FA1A|nr:prolyl-tRNA synthetase associated domain-containing protein [Turicimonas muris]